MSTEIIVALIGLAGAVLSGVVAAFIGRKKTIIHRHETASSPEQSPQGPGLLKKKAALP